MNRRELLAFGGTTLSAWIAGCSGVTDPPDRSETTAEGADTRKRETGSTSEPSETESTSETPETESTGETSETLSLDGTAKFAIVAGYPAEATDDADDADYQRETVFSPDDFTEVGPVEGGDGNLPPSVRVEPTDEAAQRFVDVLTENGFTDEGVASCRWREDPDDPGWCLFTVLNGEVTYAASLGSGLASSIESGAYLDDPSFLVSASDASEAERLRAAIRNETDQ